MKIVWSSEYEIGIPVIDNQHKRIVEYINTVHELQGQRDAEAELRAVLHNLVDYTLSHFAFEESLMEEAGYSDLADHQLAHQAFARQIEQLRKRFIQGNEVASELAGVLQSWLLKHILTDDQSYSDTVKSRLLGRRGKAASGQVLQAVRRYQR
ncbi:bacteriohemerythrin [Saccharospirillum salsuginis]|uniref:Bacteriohemerythrin n=1 Tax=Saccharospirillum salsuginis TaxID=418750 RepID=A0A918K988_9GAMM|nr:bacteriohemerythrin [Saccharospirillum salsuginis]GGX55340.1 bacteriohemerythrin [Saccharospirillum salsuginis]